MWQSSSNFCHGMPPHLLQGLLEGIFRTHDCGRGSHLRVRHLSTSGLYRSHYRSGNPKIDNVHNHITHNNVTYSIATTHTANRAIFPVLLLVAFGKIQIFSIAQLRRNQPSIALVSWQCCALGVVPYQKEEEKEKRYIRVV